MSTTRLTNSGAPFPAGRRPQYRRRPHLRATALSGFIAWLIWLTVHLVWLIGFRNRMLVLVNWAWNYLTYDRGVRLIRRASSRQHVSNGDEEAP